MRVLVAIAMTLALFEPNVANAFAEGEKVAWPSMAPRPPLASVHTVTHAPTKQHAEEETAFSRVQDVMEKIMREHNREVQGGRQHQQHEQHQPTHETTTSSSSSRARTKPMKPRTKKMHPHKPVVHEVPTKPPAQPTRNEVSLHTAHGHADAAADAANAQSGPWGNVVEVFRQAMARARAFRARMQQQEEEEQEQQHAMNPTTPVSQPPELHYSVHKGGAMPAPSPERPWFPPPPPMFEPLPLPRGGHESKHPTPFWVPMCEAELAGPLCADADAQFPFSREDMRKVFGDRSHHMTPMPSTLHMLRLRLFTPKHTSPAQRQLHQHEEESPHRVCPRRHRLSQLHCLMSHKPKLSGHCTVAVEAALQRFHLRHPDWHHPGVVEGGDVDGGRLGQRTVTGDEGAEHHRDEGKHHHGKHHHGRHHHWRHSKTARWIHHHRGFIFATLFIVVMWCCLWRRSVSQRARAVQAAKDRRAAAARRSRSSNNQSAIDVRARRDRELAAGSVSSAAAGAAAGARPKTKSKSKQKTKPSAPSAPVRQERVMLQPPATPYHRVYDEPGHARGDDGVQYPSLAPFDVPAYTPVYI